MKTAKEMFEELGYKYSQMRGVFLSYQKEIENYKRVICFYFSTKEFQCHDFRYINLEHACEYGAFRIDLDTFEAIQKQIEELGWDKNE